MTKCHICGIPIGKKFGHKELRRTRDHVVPRAKGGQTEGNIAWAHSICNRLKAHFELTDDLRAKCRTAVLKINPEILA